MYQCSELANRLNCTCSPSKRTGRLLALILKCMNAYMELWNNNKNGIMRAFREQSDKPANTLKELRLYLPFPRESRARRRGLNLTGTKTSGNVCWCFTALCIQTPV